MNIIDLFYKDLSNNYTPDELTILIKHTFGVPVVSDQRIHDLAVEHAKLYKKAHMDPTVQTYFNMPKTQLLKMAINKNCHELIQFILNNYRSELSTPIIQQAEKIIGTKPPPNISVAVPEGCVLTRRCPQGYKLEELYEIAKKCGVNTNGMGKNDICVAIRKLAAPLKAGKLYDVGAQGVTLAQEYISKKTGEPIIDPTGWLASEKFDGVRAVWDGQEFVSRSGTIYAAPTWFTAIMPRGIVLDGELFIGRDKFQETVSVVRKKNPVDREWEKITYQVFDLPLSSAGAEERIQEYIKIVNDICANFLPNQHLKVCPIKATPQIRITSAADLMKQYQNILAAGGEGMMLRKPESKYVGKRTSELLKYKPTFDAEAKIIGYETGTGKNTGILGAFIVSDQKTGKRFKVGSGITDEIRNTYLQTHPIGTVITYLYTGFTDAGVPRHPRYLRIRSDF